MTRPSTVKITSQELQSKFNNNAGGYPAKIDTLASALVYDEPANPKSHQPSGTRGQVRKYFDGKRTVMVLHCFKLPSGKLGASGKMDPKGLLVDGVYYYC